MKMHFGTSSYRNLFQYGADNETRTRDPRITNALLYQLSHIGLIWRKHDVFVKPFAKLQNYFQFSA